MTRPLGENIQKEWDAEPRAVELWEALQARKQDRAAGLAMATCLASGGSSLAMMYLGAAYVEEGGPHNLTLGEEWLMRSAKAGSIEGQVQLAMLYKRQERWSEFETELKALAGQGYPPAMEALGRLFYKGAGGRRSVPEAVHYFVLAKSAGHIFALGRLAYICRMERSSLRHYLLAQWDCVKRAPVSVWYILIYPNSDRLRQI